VSGDGYTVTLPPGFEGGHTEAEMRQGVEAAFGEGSGRLVHLITADGQTDLFAADPPARLQRTILFTEFSGSPIAALDQIVSAYKDKVVGQGVTLLGTSQAAIDGHPVTVVSYTDPSNDVQTDAYVYLHETGDGWIMEYSARAADFKEVDDSYRRSVGSFRVD
jgi:hypothetical protein